MLYLAILQVFTHRCTESLVFLSVVSVHSCISKAFDTPCCNKELAVLKMFAQVGWEHIYFEVLILPSSNVWEHPLCMNVFDFGTCFVDLIRRVASCVNVTTVESTSSNAITLLWNIVKSVHMLHREEADLEITQFV